VLVNVNDALKDITLGSLISVDRLMDKAKLLGMEWETGGRKDGAV